MSTPTLIRRTTVVTLLQGNDYDAVVDLKSDIERAARTGMTRRVGDADPMTETVEAFDGFMDAAAERAMKVGLTALHRKEYRKLRNEHPPRMIDGPEGPTTHPEDFANGFNEETFGDVIVAACMVEFATKSENPDEIPTFGDRPAAEAFLDELSDGDFSQLYSAAVSLNQGVGPDPKVRLSSLLAPTSDGTSASPGRLA